MNAFYQAVVAASFKKQMALYFEAREFNSYSAIVNLSPGNLLNGVTITKSDDGWLFKNLSYLYGAVPNYTPAEFFEYAELMWQAEQARANYTAHESVLRDAFRAAAAPQKPIITQQPQDAVITSGQTATLSVAATGTEPFQYVWELDGVPFAGPYGPSFNATIAGQYRVTIYDANTLFTKSRVAIVTVNSGEPAAITAPVAGATLSGSVTVRATASDATRIEFYLNGVRQLTDSDAPFAWAWNTATAGNGPHALTAKAYNGLALLGTSAAVNVAVNNAAPPPCDDPTEPNDSSLTATLLELGSLTNAYVCTATDVDWFRVVVTTPGVLTIALSVPASVDYDLELFGPNSAYLTGSYRDTSISESIQQTVNIPGNYYFRVYGYPAGAGDFNTTAPYTVSATFAPSAVDSTVSGQITNNTTWSGTVNLPGDVTVSSGATLTILPGTQVRCAAGSDSRSSGIDSSRVEIILNGGTLNAAGTSGSPIVFTSAAATKSPGNWYGIRVIEGDVTMSHCLVEYAVDGIRFEDTDTRFNSYALNDVTVQRCSGNGVWTTSGEYAQVTLNNFLLWTNATGLNANGPVTVAGGQVKGNTGYGVNANSGPFAASGVVVGFNGSYGIYSAGAATLTGCVVTNNQSDGVYVGSSLQMSGCTLARNNGWGLSAWPGGNLTPVEIWNSPSASVLIWRLMTLSGG